MSFRHSDDRLVISSVKLVICNALIHHGIDPIPLCQAVGLSMPDRLHPMKRDRTLKVAQLLNLASKITDDPSFALQVVRHLDLSAFASFGAAISASSTLETAVLRGQKYSRLITDSVTFEVIDEGHLLTTRLIRLEKEPTQSYDNLMLLYIAALLHVGRSLGATRSTSHEVRLEQIEPINIEPFQDYFCCPIVFSQPWNSITISKKISNTRIAPQDPRVSQLAQDLAGEELHKLSALTVAEEVCAYIENTLAEGEPKIAAVASAMGLSPRSLQRKLATENHTFAQLLDDTRKRLANHLIRKPSEQIKSLAYDLGFSDQSNFNRAFKRWYSVSPTEFRRKCREEQW